MADENKVEWISVGTGDDHFMDVSVGEVQRKLAALGYHIQDAQEHRSVLDKLQMLERAKMAAAVIDFVGLLDVGLTTEELDATKNLQDMKEEYLSLQKAFRKVQEVLRG